jgi:hypothetical protein
MTKLVTYVTYNMTLYECMIINKMKLSMGCRFGILFFQTFLNETDQTRANLLKNRDAKLQI